ncbi:Small subunit processome component like [Actinidia chinensis var. chinensis]|uniref:Small subunit processome component like n=1 Tax=Actinidia chinensis var. chinensis TaxID=1590841 RepID=A0A2R6S066_ACTCC|nr:Small subunit processome component like [Actinidia chinensis var. chinensis]
MATATEALAVKSLNKSPGRRRFVFKTFSQRVEEIDIDVFRCLAPLKSEPSEGSSFFRDCLVEWRELNTAEDFISFYEEMMPLVQTLPQIILHKELILSKLLSRLQLKGRLSLEPILRLIAALSRDLLEDFLPFMQRVADSLVSLLNNGADREPEILEQIFTSWSYIMMYLQKYLVQEVIHVLRVTAKLRYHPKDYVQEFMAEAVSFLLRNAPIEQLIKGIRKVMVEVAKKPLAFRKSGASALLWYVMRGTSSKLHSRAEHVLRLLVDKSIFGIGDKFSEGSQSVLEVVTIAFQRLCEELEPSDLDLMWNCLYEEIIDAVSNGCSLHLSHLLSLLISTVQIGYIQKIYDYQPMLQVVQVLIQKFVLPLGVPKAEDQCSEIVDRVLQLLLHILDGFHLADNMSGLSSLSVQWAPVFELRNSSLLSFIKQLVQKDARIAQVFRQNIIRALNDLIVTSEEEVILLLLIFCERLQVQAQSSCFLEGTSKEEVSRIRSYLQDAISDWIGIINQIVHGDSSTIQLQETKLALLWGIISCYPYVTDIQTNSSLLLDFVDAIDQLLVIECDNIAGFHKHTWQSLIGATLSSYNKLGYVNIIRNEELSKFLLLATRYRSSSQILSAVADFLDSMDRSTFQEETSNVVLPPELKAEKAMESLGIFAENLCHSDKLIRLSTLRILCHFELLNYEHSPKDEHAENKTRTDVSKSCFANDRGSNVLQLLLSIEDTPLSVTTSRKVILTISRIQMGLSAARVPETYLPSVLYGVIGIFHNRFSHLWDPASECLAVLISVYFRMTLDRFVQYLEQCQSNFLASHDQSDGSETQSASNSCDLVERFNLFVSPTFDNTPCATVLSLLIQSLQKVPIVIESRSRQIVPLFLKFMGYNIYDDFSVGSFNTQACKGKEWKNVLREWLTLLKVMRNPKSFYRAQILKEVLQYRLLDENDAEIQTTVLDCLLNWKDDFLLPYDLHLKNLISSKSLREELTTWSLSKESNLIEERHRSDLVPLVIRILVPKVRNLKTLASRKHTSVHHRKAVLGFLAQLEVDELPLFFALLIKPLLRISQGFDGMYKWFWSSSESSKDDFDSCSVLKHFTMDNIVALSWKKKYGFLHVIEDILAVFDELHVKPCLNLLMGCVVRILGSCTSIIDSGKSSGLSVVEKDFSFRHETGGGVEDQITTSTSMKHFKELRSLCLKIISLVLNKYEDHEFGFDFWELFFTSVKPLIDGFKQEGASSEKPSSLFSCFLSMSGSYKLVSLLYREENLVPDIFSILTVPAASEAILSCVLKFVENLLNLDSELDHEDSAIKRILIPNIDALICGLHCLFKSNNATMRKLVKFPGERELNIFKLLSKYIKDTSAAIKFVEILLPLLTKGVQNSDVCVEALHVIRHIIPVLESESTKEILNAASLLLISVGLEVRMSICDLIDALGATDSSVIPLAKLLRELNSTSAMEMGGLDYESVLNAYEKINKDFFYSVGEKHALVILSHAVHDMTSEELILRQSGYRLLLSFVEFSAEIFDRELESDDQCWSEVCILRIINNFLFKHMGDAMNKGAPIQKVWIGLLQEMVLKLPKVPSLKSLGVLCSEDAEQDFFNNIIHLQKHRRARALSRFRNFVNSGNLSEVITNKVFIPLFFNMLFEIQEGKAENIRSACLEALASISGNMEWKSYYAFLMRCFREMTLKPVKQKVLIRLICSVLDQFHFMKTHSGHAVKDCVLEVSKVVTNGMTSSTVLRPCSSSAEVSEIQSCLQKSVLPKIQKLLTSDSDKFNVNISLVALKLLKLLPADVMDLQLPNIIHRISNFLKSHLDSVRSEARVALAACLKELGLEYLQFIVKALRATLKRGYELHVLGYTLNFILSKCLVNPISGKLDYCLEELLSVVENDILGDVSEEKEVEKIASKMKETRKLKSFETLRLVAQNITFKTHALKLLLPVTARLQKHLTPKVKSKLESMLSNIAAGIDCNPSVNQTDLFVFLYGLIEDGITSKTHTNKSSSVANKQSGNEAMRKMGTSGGLIDSGSQSSHLITVFALGLMHNSIKNTKLHEKDELLLSMLDPFVRLLSECLTSKYEDVISAAVRCLAPLMRLPLPSLESQADMLKTSLLVIAQGSINTSSPLMQSCLRLLTVLLRNTRITLSSDQLHMVIQFPLFIDLERNPSFVALSLLKAIVNRKLVVHEIYDLVSRVAELMVTSQVEPIRKKCSQILLQFLLDYRLSEKRLQQHLDFLLSNLRYEHSTGRETVLEMLHAIVIKFPKAIIDEHSQAIFVHLVVCLANDNDNKVRSMTGAAIKLLIGHVSAHSLHSILEYSLSWYLGGKQHLWCASAQVLGLLIEVMKKGFQKHINSVLPVIRSICHSAVDVLTNSQLDLSIETRVPFWKEAYYSLMLLEKILQQFPDLCLARDLEDMWETISELLLHPHMWLRNVLNRLVALYFTSVTKANKENHEKPLGTFFLMRPSRLFLIAVSLCCQLKAPLIDNAASTLITQNLAFAICGVHSLLGLSKGVDAHSIWSTLEQHEQGRFLKAFQLLDSGKGKSMFASLTSGDNNQNDEKNGDHRQSLLVSFLLKRMGKIALQTEAVQMKIVFHVFKSISPKIIDLEKLSTQTGDSQGYAFQILLPLYKVCEGYAGKLIPDDVKQLAQETLESMRGTIGMTNFVQVYSQIRKNIKAKRDKRKQEEKVMAVVNPMRNAKRKLRIAAKNRANKKRKVMTMKMTKWMR